MNSHITRYIHKDSIFFMKHSLKDEVLSLLSQSLTENLIQLYPSRAAQFQHANIENAIVQRERLMSTGIGMGIAIPHAKTPEIPNFLISVGIFEQGIEWDAIDSSLIRVVFMIIGPDSNPKEYLYLLSALTNIVKSDESRRKLMAATTAETVLEILSKT
ncbi:MAG: PTS sugar transporter subunit IIA [Chlamydia sp.]